MALFIPTSDMGMSNSTADDYFERAPVKGQIRNLDTDTIISFQFNPEEFEHAKPNRWTNIQAIGGNSDNYQFLGQSRPSFELTLLFIDDVGMPPMVTSGIDPTYSQSDQGSNSSIGFDRICDEFNFWLKEQPETGLPAELMVIYGRRSFVGFIQDFRERILDMYSDGTTRRGTITFQFQAWS